MHFETELNYIQDPIVKDIATQGVNMLPDYFYKISASSTGKYHPSYTVGEEGLYRHVKAAVSIAKMLFTIHNFTQLEQDMIIASLILHDGWKQGIDGSRGFTEHAHPLIASKVLRERVEVDTKEGLEYLFLICDGIETHMGQFTTNKYDFTILPSPITPMQHFIHLADYLASRKALEFNFSVEIK